MENARSVRIVTVSAYGQQTVETVKMTCARLAAHMQLATKLIQTVRVMTVHESVSLVHLGTRTKASVFVTLTTSIIKPKISVRPVSMAVRSAVLLGNVIYVRTPTT
jgi:hypothetical protein